MSVPKMHSGGIGQYNRMLQAPLYEKISDILGSTGTIIPIKDQIESGLFRPSSTVPALDPTYVGGDPTTWATPFSFNDPDSYKGYIPKFTFDGSSESFSFPDNGYWTRAEGSKPFSIGVWVNVPSGFSGLIISKRNSGANEWHFSINANDTLQVWLYDESTNVAASYTSDAAIPTDQWVFLVVTYDSTGGASAMSDANSPLYVNGSVVAGTPANDGSYVGMEDKSGAVKVGGEATNSTFQGDMAGGALGLFFVHTELSAAQITHLYRLGRQALEL